MSEITELSETKMGTISQREIMLDVANAPQAYKNLSSLTATEQHKVLLEWNSTEVVYAQDQCIHQLFEAQVRRTPDAVAVIFEEEQLTYQALNQRANHLAHMLRRLGVVSDTLVGLYVERSLEMVIGLLGILKAGGAYVPLDPTYPKARLDFIMQDAQPSILMTQERLLSRLPDNDAQVVCIATNEAAFASEDAENIDSGVKPDNLVYVIYTSGSTGTPKGILTKHQSLVNYTEYACKTYGLRAGERVLQFASINFDASAEEMYPCLVSGATLVLRTGAMLNSIAMFLHICAEKCITLLDLPTAYWHELTLRVAEEGLLIPQSVRVVIIGGERALPERFHTWQKLVGHNVRLFNTYGPTETTVVVTVSELTTVEQAQYGSASAHPLPVVTVSELTNEVSIGRPIANTQIYLLDATLQPVSIGMPGEMYVGGVGLARGYHKRPELTAERFIVNPFSDKPGARIYKTGDLARYLPNGELEFLGRVDHQVKIRGFRIEPGEIEAVLRQYSGIRDVVVLAREDIPGDKRLVAYVIAQAGQTWTSRELLQFLKDRLPEYMIPTAFVPLAVLPLTPNGKIDQRSLPPPSTGRDRTEDDFVAPTSLLHQQLIDIWEQVLNVRPIGIRDNFFYLGGHSLLAARMVARVEQVCGKRLSLTTLFAGPTIEQVADALQKEEGPRPRTPLVAVQIGSNKRPFFFLHGDPTGGAFYCFPLARGLGAEQPFYVLEPYRFDGMPVPPTMEAMAAEHITALRTIQPEGPYQLGGWCDGGLMAYEMAQQLQAQGQQITLLVLMDPGSASRFGKLFHDGIRLAGRLLQLREEKQVEWYLRLQHMYDAVRLLRHRRDQETTQLKKMGSLQAADIPKKAMGIHFNLNSLFPSTEILYQNYRDLYNWVCSEYTISLYAGKITMFWAKEEPFRGIWRRKVAHEKNIVFHFIPGAHMTCRTDHLHVMADLLRKCLHEVQVVITIDA